MRSNLVIACKREVLLNGKQRDKSFLTSVFRHKTEAFFHVRKNTMACGLSVVGDSTGILFKCTVNAGDKLCTAGTDESSDTEDLSAVSGKADSFEHVSVIEIFYFKDIIVIYRLAYLVIGIFELMPDHHFDDAAGFYFFLFKNAYIFTVSHDRQSVGETIDLIKTV